MPINPDYPEINGITPSWADIVAKATPDGAALLELKDIAKISRKRTVSVGKQKGASGGRTKKTTTGSVEYELSVTFYRDGYQNFLRRLASIAPVRGNQKAIRFVYFGVNVQHTPQGSEEIFEWRAKSCFAMGDSMEHAEGDAPDQIEIPIYVTEIVDMIDGEEVVYL